MPGAANFSRPFLILSLAVVLLLVHICAAFAQPPALSRKPKQETQPMEISSPAFTSGKPIPAKFTCDGENVSPALAWANVPAAAKSLVLVCDDPDAPRGTWVHWLVINLPPQTAGLAEKGPLPQGAREITNSFGKKPYGGPCPPGGTHRYFFKLYALDIPDLAGATLANFRTLLGQHTLAQAECMGTYQRK